MPLAGTAPAAPGFRAAWQPGPARPCPARFRASRTRRRWSAPLRPPARDAPRRRKLRPSPPGPSRRRTWAPSSPSSSASSSIAIRPSGREPSRGVSAASKLCIRSRWFTKLPAFSSQVEPGSTTSTSSRSVSPPGRVSISTVKASALLQAGAEPRRRPLAGVVAGEQHAADAAPRSAGPPRRPRRAPRRPATPAPAARPGRWGPSRRRRCTRRGSPCPRRGRGPARPRAGPTGPA